MGTVAIAVEEGWVQCLGEVRPLRGGLVRCPLRGAVLDPGGECLACHHLETLSDERTDGASCATPDSLRSVAAPLR